jgi:hypothetical protein
MESWEKGDRTFRGLQNDQVKELVQEGPYLDAHKEALLELRQTNGWNSSEDVALVPEEGKVIICKKQWDSSMGYDTEQYKIVDGSLRESLEALQKMNQLPDYATDFKIVEIAPVDGIEVTRRILEKLSGKISEEAEGFDEWPTDKQREFLAKWGFSNQ